VANKIVIWDSVEGPVETPEQKVRPREPGILQLDMQEFDTYTLYEYPDTVMEFESIDDFRREVTKKVRNALLKEVPLRDLEYESTTLVDRGISLMANFKIANIILKDRTAFKVVLPPERAKGRARLGNLRL
jgi:hypothetical protein